MNLRLAKTDAIVAIYILVAFIMLIVPLPAALLDVFMAFNIAVAFTVLFVCMFSQEVLDLSSFPTILLFTTIFRIAMNVSSTRLILTTGDSGNVVKTFGQFVGGGDLIVGAIIFIILIMIQFLVINKGSERVAEVTARFTLDAMPGKQMAIDADLNTGAIDDREAKERRDKIQQESSFFGSMDGAVKYVKGDAIAGLLLTVINLVGGIAMGVLRGGVEISAALDTYGILTIGDGLVSQIPSLLIALSTGVLVTKGSKEAEFGPAIIKQLFGIPKVMYLVGGTLSFLGVATELNTILFLGMGLLFIVGGRIIAGNLETEAIEREVRSFRHDYKNLLAGLSQQAGEGELEGLRRTLSELDAGFDRRLGQRIQASAQIGNLQIPEVRSLLLSKLTAMGEKGVECRLEALYPVTSVHMDVWDYVRCLGILIDNALEAALDTERPWVEIVLLAQDGRVFLRVSNPYVNRVDPEGMWTEGWSTKGAGRGLGLPSYQRILEGCPGASPCTSWDGGVFVQELTVGDRL